MVDSVAMTVDFGVVLTLVGEAAVVSTLVGAELTLVVNAASVFGGGVGILVVEASVDVVG